MDTALGFGANMPSANAKRRGRIVASIAQQHTAVEKNVVQQKQQQQRSPSPQQRADDDGWCYATACSRGSVQLYDCDRYAQPPTASIDEDTRTGGDVLLFYPMIRAADNRVFMRLRTVDAVSGQMKQFWAVIHNGAEATVTDFRIH